MSFSRDVKLVFTARDFEYDSDSHSKNLRLLEAFMELPSDFLPLLVKTDQPNVSELRSGSDAIVNVGGVLYHLVNGVWEPIQDNSNSYTNAEIDALIPAPSPVLSIESASHAGIIVGAQTTAGFSLTPTCNTTDTMVYLRGVDDYTGLAVAGLRVVAANHVEIRVINVKPSVVSTGSVTFYFLRIHGLTGPP